MDGGLDRRSVVAIAAGVALGASAASAEAAAPARSARFKRLPVADRLEIIDLFSAYGWANDCADADEFLSLFTSDAVVVGRGKLYSDRAAIRGWFDYLIGIRDKEGADIWMHEAGQFRFVPESPSRCIVYAYATHFSGRSSETARNVRSLGYFVAECAREADGTWRFRRFSISTWDSSKLPWKKPLPWADL